MTELALTQIRGIGPATAKQLEEAGLGTVEAVAGAEPDQLAAVPGFGPLRAAGVIEAAASLVTENQSDSKPVQAEQATPPPSVEPEKTRKTGEKTGKKKSKKGRSAIRKLRKELKGQRKELLGLLSEAAEKLAKAGAKKKRKKLKAHIADLEAELAKTERKIQKTDRKLARLDQS